MFVLALTGSVRFIGRAPGVLIGVLWGLLLSSPKAGAEGLPFGIVRALDPCVHVDACMNAMKARVVHF